MTGHCQVVSIDQLPKPRHTCTYTHTAVSKAAHTVERYRDEVDQQGKKALFGTLSKQLLWRNHGAIVNIDRRCMVVNRQSYVALQAKEDSLVICFEWTDIPHYRHATHRVPLLRLMLLRQHHR